MKRHSGFYILIIASAMLFILETSLSAETIWQKRQKVLQTEPQAEKQEPKETSALAPEEDITADDMTNESVAASLIETTDPYAIKIPEQYGTIIESSKGANNKLIIYIQDAHANYDAQMNEANIVESLMKNFGAKLIFREGGVTNSDFSYLREKTPLEQRKERARKLLQGGVITSDEYITIATDYPIAIQGIEDKALYDANREALWKMDSFKDAAVDYVNKLRAVADQIKPKIYSAEIIEFDKKKKDYDAESIDLVEYYRYLYKKAEEKGAYIGQFSNFAALVKANDLEKGINMANAVSDKATDEEKVKYKEYTDLLKNLNVQKLFKEEPLLENALKDELAENDDQKELLNISKALGIMKSLLIIKAVPEEYDYFVENKKYFDPELWTSFLQEKADANGISVNMPQNKYVMSDNIDKIENFYKIAFERNKAFINKIENRINKDNPKLAVLIAGGFHTPKLTQLLNDKGYSYVVISPRVTTQTNDALYRSLLKREWLPGVQ